MAKRRQSRFVLELYVIAFHPELIEDGIHIDGVPKNDLVDDQDDCAQLIFLTLPTALVQFSALAVEHISRQTVSTFGKVELL